ncbi:S46 family peptidase [Sphingomonas sp.]|uniref:S46 family peptidase n=1 Tax=Sphingomonas sp. TaxID=28214 RepID=UPI003F70CDF2
MRHRFLLLAPLILLAGPVAADEGMWLPSQTEAIGDKMRAAGLELDPKTLGDLNRAPLNAIVSLGGCSAAFLSDQGLIATNHHCVYGSIQYNSSPEHNYLRDGFLARTLGDELPAAPGSRVYVIEDLRDVTADVLRGATKLAGEARNGRIETNRKALIAACEKKPNRRCDVRAYFGGKQYFLQQQLEIQDVRLVYAPAGGVGNFGGEIDNWQWPRHTGDFGFYRAYVAPDGSSAPYSKDNVPFKPKAWLPIAKQGLKEGDFIMVAGFPGTTERHRTGVETRFYFEKFYPLQQRLLAEYSDAITAATASSPELAIRYASILKGTDNYKKKILGQLAGADAIRLIERKESDEQAFRAWVAADATRRERWSAGLTALDTQAADANAAALETLRRGLLDRGQLYAAAMRAYRWSLERAKPDAQRKSGFQDRDRRALQEALTQIERRFDPAVDRALFEKAVAEYRQLPAASRNAGFDAALDKIGMDALYRDTKLGTTANRIALLDMTADALKASTDPFVQLAIAAYPDLEAREAATNARAGNLQAARSTYMDARMGYAASQGRTLYPDANSSLRFSYGTVKAKKRDGMAWTAFTTGEGIVEKQTGKEPFNAPQKTIDLIKAKDYGAYTAPELGTLPVNYLGTVDITNGNSGSSTLNARGEFVGLVFDGTIEGIISDWWFDPSITRSIHVDSRYIFWTMAKVDGAQRLLDEMKVK